MSFVLYEFGFSTNADAVNILIFGKDIQTWLIYTLVFLGFTAIGFLSVWMRAFFRDLRSGKPVKQPWD